jgi:CubicO group peptidase (beta-lactamase class C family)
MPHAVMPAEARIPAGERRRRPSLPGPPAFAGATLAFLLLAAPAPAQVDRPEYVRALAAGYKAGFLCSNIFNGGLSEAQTEADDLKGTYAELDPIFPLLPAEIDRKQRQVRVRYSDRMPPRIAQWRPALGCAHLPIGSPPEAAARLPDIVGAGSDHRETDNRPWPMGDLRATARPRGDAAALARALTSSFDGRTYGAGTATTAVLVLQGDRIVAERYRSDFGKHNSQRTWSVAKSIAATVIGRAAHMGIVDVNAPVGLAGAGIAMGPPVSVRAQRPWPRIPEWRKPEDPRGAITTDQLLRMASGLHSDFAGNRTDALYFGGIGISEQAAGFPLVSAPGSVFRYANNDIVLAIRALQYGLGDSGAALAFPFEHLFWRIGMTRTAAETDHNGHFIMSSQVWTTARDLARLGLLHLEDGVWQGERLLPPGWNDYIRRRGPAQPAGGYGYGAGWWTFPGDSGLPGDAFIAQGNRGQYVVVVPSRRVVIVRRGFDRVGARFDPAALARDVLAALR